MTGSIIRSDAPDASTESHRAGITLRRFTFEGRRRVETVSAGTQFCFDLRGHREAFAWRAAGRRSSPESTPGSLYLLPSGADFAIETQDGGDVLSILVSDDTLGLAAGEQARPNLHVREVVAGQDSLLLATSHAMEAEAAQAYPNGILFWSSLTSRVVERLVSRYLPSTPRTLGGVLSSRALGRINAFIDASLDQPITVQDLAHVAAQSRFHFQRTFRRSLGLTPHRYVMLVRLKKAAALIRASRLPLAAIAADTGFVDQSHLSRWVGDVYGTTPARMRAR